MSNPQSQMETAAQHCFEHAGLLAFPVLPHQLLTPGVPQPHGLEAVPNSSPDLPLTALKTAPASVYIASTHANGVFGRAPKCHHPTAQLKNLRWRSCIDSSFSHLHTSFVAIAIEGLPLQGNTLCLKPMLPERHILFPQSLVTPTQSYKHSLSLWKSQPWLGFVGTFLRRLPLKWSMPFSETQAGAWRNADLCGQVENWIWPLHFTLHKHSSHSTVPFCSGYKENTCHSFTGFALVISQKPTLP